MVTVQRGSLPRCINSHGPPPRETCSTASQNLKRGPFSTFLDKVSYAQHKVGMPNAIAPNKRSITYLENISVIEWMKEIARARQTDLAVILREATSAYYVQYKDANADVSTHLNRRSAAKAAQRARTAGEIASSILTPAAAQKKNAPIVGSVRTANLWGDIRRHHRRKDT